MNELLAPVGFATVQSKLDESIKAAQRGSVGEADALATAGMEALTKVNADAAQSADLFREVLDARVRAEEAGAWQVLPDKASALDGQLRDAASLVEDGKIEAAKKTRQTLIDGYTKLELKSLKEGAVEVARATIASAKDKGAHRLAPKTFKLAEEEMSLAKSVLDANREDTERANDHATRATSLAARSMQISELIEDFDRRDYTREDSVLWYQSQLTEIYQPVGALEFDRPNRDVVLGMQEKYADLLLRETTAELVTQEQQEELAMRDKIEADRRKQFEQVQSMFLPTEATVYRQRENVLISAHGFQFPTGRSEFESENFAVANKVIQAIAIFPGSRIEITGHTDSTGGAETNRKLSKERAANVMKFLNEIGQIPMERLSSEGYGEDRPFASNKTEEGRAQNRRVDILIKND
jgi:outer membrane protein OmpA-like peptidoglycan-associated protein